MLYLPASVIDAWSLAGDIEPLDGGQGTCVRVDDLVLKPQPDDALVLWHAQLCDRVTASGFRLPAPVRSDDGRLVVDGWYAMEFASGQPISDDDGAVSSWSTVVACSRAFHAAVADEPRPVLLDARTDRWAVADRAAWGEGDPPEIGQRSITLLHGMREHLLDEGLPSQLVHGDMAGNVLLSEGQAPAVIDLSPYWRPAEYPDAVIVVDALLWWRAEPLLMEAVRPPALSPAQWRSLLARALAFRLLTVDETRGDAHELDDELDRYSRVLDQLAHARSIPHTEWVAGGSNPEPTD